MDQKFDHVLSEGIDKCLSEKGLTRSKANSIQLGNALTKYYLSEIGQYLFKIPEDEIAGATCDGKNDLGIDFAYKQDDTWLIIQSKYKGYSSAVAAGEIADFFNIIGRLDGTAFFEKHASSATKEALCDYRTGDAVNFLFLTNDKITHRIEDEFKKLQTACENEAVSYELKGLRLSSRIISP